jgi:hypothetical protein
MAFGMSKMQKEIWKMNIDAMELQNEIMNAHFAIKMAKVLFSGNDPKHYTALIVIETHGDEFQFLAVIRDVKRILREHVTHPDTVELFYRRYEDYIHTGIEHEEQIT